MDASMMTALQRYIQKQRLGSPDGGLSGAPQGPGGPLGAGGQLAVPQGPGIADPYNQGLDEASMDDPRRKTMRPYLGV